jgi:hypothetical protein
VDIFHSLMFWKRDEGQKRRPRSMFFTSSRTKYVRRCA